MNLGARQLIEQVVEAELKEFMGPFSCWLLSDGRGGGQWRPSGALCADWNWAGGSQDFEGQREGRRPVACRFESTFGTIRHRTKRPKD